MSKFKLSNQAITLINRGGLKFQAQKVGNDVIFDTDVFADPRNDFTSAKLATPLGAKEILAAQEEVIALAKAMNAEVLDKSKKSE